MEQKRVVVFAPSPQLTVTIERPAHDDELHVHPGGQGVWQGRMITGLGVPVVMCVALGGELGEVLRPLLEAEGFELRVIERDAGSGGYVHDRRGGSREELVDLPGAPLSRHDMDELYAITLAEGLDATVCVLSGPAHPSVVTADLYRRLAADLANVGGRVVADLSGEHLSAVLAGKPAFVKVSHEEVIEDGRATGDDEPALIDALHRLRGDGAQAALISRADQPALALLGERVVRVQAPQLEAAEPRGAGDSMTAGVAAVLARGGDLETAVRTGAAAGALNVTRHGLGTGRADAIARLVERVRLDPITMDT